MNQRDNLSLGNNAITDPYANVVLSESCFSQRCLQRLQALPRTPRQTGLDRAIRPDDKSNMRPITGPITGEGVGVNGVGTHQSSAQRHLMDTKEIGRWACTEFGSRPPERAV